MTPVIAMKNASKRFGRSIALDNVSWEVPAGVIFALLGENGAGKTTSIRTLLGLESLDTGSAQVLGFDSARQGIEIRRRVGYVPEQPALYEWMTVAEIGWFAAGFYDEEFLPRYHKIVGDAQLPLKRRIRELSKGMRAQISLALAQSHDPEVLILDEPTSGLDVFVRRQFLQSMVDWAARGKTVLLSSHQIGEVERVADIVAIIKEGRLLLCESLEQLKARLEFWTISLAEGQPRLPPMDVDVMHEGKQGSQIQLLVNNPASDALWRWRGHAAIAHIEVHVPSLEEIVMTVMRRDGAAPLSSSTAHSTRSQEQTS